MWVLRYEYDLEDGTPRNVSTCLQSGQTYSIGRSSKSVLNIKNDKSISRNHISIIWEKENGQIKLRNQGKLTAAGGKYLKVGEDMNFDDHLFKSKAIVVELGTKPIKVEVSWKDEIWDIPRQFADLKEELGVYGIEVQVGTAETRPTMIVMGDNEAHRNLWGVVLNVPLRTKEYLQSVRDVLSTSGASFDDYWAKLDRDGKMTIITNRYIKDQILSGLKFYLIEKNDQVIRYTDKAVKAGHGKLVVVENREKLLDLLKLESSAQNIVLIRSSNSKVDVSQFGITTFTLDDIITTIQEDSTAKLISRVPEVINAAAVSQDPSVSTLSPGAQQAPPVPQLPEQLDQEIQKPPAKKRRLNRRAVKPLDSLMFFAGGDSFKRETDESLPPADTPGKAASLPKDEQDVSNVESQPTILHETKEQPRPHGRESPEGPADHQNAPESCQPVGPIGNNSAPVNDSEEANDHYNGINRSEVDIDVSKQDISVDYERPSTNKRVSTRQRTLRDTSPSESSSHRETTPKEDLVEVINETKNREVKRFNSTLVKVASDELTEEAINQLGNLVIVQPNDSLLRERQVDSHGHAANDQQPWHGRKNFKNFLKIQPKHKHGQLNAAYREGSSDFIRNSAFLLTREYVPLKPYSKESMNRMEDFSTIPKEQTLSPAPADHPVQRSPEQLDLSQHSNGANSAQQLFVVDDDDSQNAPATLREEQSIQTGELPIVDELPSRQELGSKLGSRKESRARNHTRFRRSDLGEDDDDDDNDDDDNDDDDDDEPKFKFRRRMR